ncbi:class I SAM-dependent methyltransferase [Adhaeretor mobilis]|uniref:Cypemycin methyltransferase n=1 Tax=Adhaeretor mobilis TaxID=1930276 RepID=A0A517MRI1_9BACT|nr:class I SAM-dependent methyltransferase [Adhaeretor mobilis]QDS97492.1 Cypemycin methyltransferase [Adhaeretor mobilis]
MNPPDRPQERPQERPRQPPAWKLPPGVSRGLWDYVHSESIATDYDDYFAHNTLFDFDSQMLAEAFDEPGLVVDLGCGTGRALTPLVEAGHRGLAVDLSLPMLKEVQQKATDSNLPIECLQANLVELDTLADASVDYAMCMFSTLGMIRGRESRRKFLAHTHRILKPGGHFVLHVHNYWYNLRDPGGPWWLLKNLVTAPFQKEVELGDKWFPYRGLPSMFLHVFRWTELAADLRAAGFTIEKRVPLDATRRHALPWPWLFGPLRANGWIVVCRQSKLKRNSHG